MIARLYTRPLGDTVEQDPRGTVGADPIITSGPPSHPADDEPLPETPVPMIVTVGVPPPGQDISNPPTSGPAETEIVEVPVIAPAPPIAPSQDISSPPTDTSSPTGSPAAAAAASSAAVTPTTTATTPESGATLTNPVILLTTTPPATTATDSFVPSGGGAYTPGGAGLPATGSGPGTSESASDAAFLSTDNPFDLSMLTGSLRNGIEKLASAASATSIPLWAWGALALGAGYWLSRKETRRR